jgi:hypothetical protein
MITPQIGEFFLCQHWAGQGLEEGAEELEQFGQGGCLCCPSVIHFIGN